MAAVWADINGGKHNSGGMAEVAVVEEVQVGLAPSTLNGTEAGTIPLVGLTALEMWRKILAAYKGEPRNATVVVTSGTGGTDFMSVQLAKRVYGAAKVVTAASGAGIPFAAQLGADLVVDYKVQSVIEAVADDSVDVVLDNYGEPGTADKAMRKLRAGGVYLVLPGGNGGGISKRPKPGVTQINFGYTSSGDHTGLDELKAHFESRALRAHVFAQVPLASAAQAFALDKSGTVLGKVAVVA